MFSSSKDVKKDLDDIRAISEFKQVYQQVTEEMLGAEQWTPDEKEAMHLLSQGHEPESIRKQVKLEEESNKKIADMYFMILLNTLIRNKTKMPFNLPENEIDSWSENYSRNQFATDLLKHKKELSATPVGKEVMKTASGYAALYESTVGPKPDRSVEQLEQGNELKQNESSAVDKACNTVGFLYGLVDGLSFSAAQPFPGALTMGSQSASAGYAAGMFAKGVFEMGGLVASLMK
ncbi:hypothetical protein OQJ26_00735 [Legionella sp. PATHC038]|uniref:hypothetical protein n=1 Tax=Legionella sheltonii TaxID=2992041 RepID=UPI0022433742|nr:hypothetical protein [Legionella sp. PATHC038]MCW8397319.1 hypothetical protein [Legionella sp. PATHC038]